MKRVVSCPYCNSGEVVIEGYEDGGGDDGDELTECFICWDCGRTFTIDEIDKVFIIDDDERKSE